MTASVVFVDILEAFDTLHRSSIPVILRQYNVPICLISDITQMYSYTSACVSTELGPTEWFKTTSGVLQGDTLSPYLFIVLLDYALKKTLQDDMTLHQNIIDKISITSAAKSYFNPIVGTLSTT